MDAWPREIGDFLKSPTDTPWDEYHIVSLVFAALKASPDSFVRRWKGVKHGERTCSARASAVQIFIRVERLSKPKSHCTTFRVRCTFRVPVSRTLTLAIYSAFLLPLLNVFQWSIPVTKYGACYRFERQQRDDFAVLPWGSLVQLGHSDLLFRLGWRISIDSQWFVIDLQSAATFDTTYYICDAHLLLYRYVYRAMDMMLAANQDLLQSVDHLKYQTLFTNVSS